MDGAIASSSVGVAIDRTGVGRDLGIVTVNLYNGATGEAFVAAPDRFGNIAVMRGGQERASSSAGKLAFVENPYMGLEAFQETDAARFFGRDAITSVLWEKFRSLVSKSSSGSLSPRFLPILGPSGSGKSSLMRAGLIPRLIRDPISGFSSPRVAIFTPSVHPIESLARVLARIDRGGAEESGRAEEFEKTLTQTFSSGRREGLHRIVEALPNVEYQPVILLIDQFEEVFSLCNDPKVQRTFFDNLMYAAGNSQRLTSVVITLRTDFLGATVHHQELNHAISKMPLFVPVMLEHERRDAIERPAIEGGRPIDIVTVDLLMEQTAGHESALPLLQFVLSRIWEGLERDQAPAETLKNLGGVGGALAGEAESIYSALDDRERNIVRRIFLSLIQLGEGTRDTLRRSKLSEMIAVSESEQTVRNVLDQFSNPGRRLITMSSNPDQETTVSIAHEALIDNWRTLNQWIETSREDIRLHRRLSESATNWYKQACPEGLLWRSPDLDLLKLFCSRNKNDLTAIETTFFDTAIELEIGQSQERQRREQKEQEYTQNQSILDAVGQLSMGIVILDERRTILQVNSGFETMTNTSAGAVGLSCFELFTKDCRGEISQLLEDCTTKPYSAGRIEVSLVGPRQSFVLLSAISLDEGAASQRLLLCLVDITEQRSLEVQFAQSQKMQAIGQLAGGIAHDFNNVLTAIIGHCDLLFMTHNVTDPSFADINQIKQNANRAADLVRQLLAFSSKQTMMPKVLSLPDAIAETTTLLGRLLGETIEISIRHARDLGLVKVDQGQLEQVIVNLSVNARDAMKEGGTLNISTYNVSEEDCRELGHTIMPESEYVCIEIADSGKGIAREDLVQIFEPFFTTKGVGEGTGLGLSTVYGIVKQTGGHIFAESEVGVGTTFRIYLPRHEAEETSIAEIEKAEPADLSGTGTILLVEGEDAVRAFASRALSTRGYTVLEAANAKIALDIVDERGDELDLVISDVVMPNMDGPTMAKKVRESYPGIKVIFISGYTEDAFEDELDRPDDFVFLPKPFSLKQLASKVKEVLKGE